VFFDVVRPIKYAYSVPFRTEVPFQLIPGNTIFCPETIKYNMFVPMGIENWCKEKNNYENECFYAHKALPFIAIGSLHACLNQREEGSPVAIHAFSAPPFVFHSCLFP